MNQTLRASIPTLTLKQLRSGGMLASALLLSSLFVLELIPASAFVRNGRGGSIIPKWFVAFAVFFVAFGYRKARSSFQSRFASQVEQAPLGWRYLIGHFGAMFAFLALSTLPAANDTSYLQTLLITGTWFGSGLIAVILAVFAFFPPAFCFQLMRGAGWIYAAVAATVACALIQLRMSLWGPATRLTFASVASLLRLVVSDVVVDPKTSTIGTQRFNVGVEGSCSGLEGLGLMLVFGILWLWFFRKECRFPQALLLVPVGLVTIWICNTVRIATLILIGHFGAPGVAERGFHSQAGWIAFNLVALGFSLSAQRLPWFSVRAAGPSLEHESIENPTAAYLVPFLMILAAAMISRAASGGFEWLYPLRFFAAAAALWFFRSKYASLDWHFGWLAPATGGVVFLMWLGLDSLSGTQTDNGIAAGLASWPQAAAIAWLTMRTLAAVVTVPIAEELAFRGFLIRRLISSDFESLDPKTFTFVSVLVSSIAFGLLHGNRWVAGIVAGLLYAAVFLRRGRIGDAVAAHATTNALLAVWVLLHGAWYMW